MSGFGSAAAYGLDGRNPAAGMNKKDARRVLAAVMVSLGRSQDPLATFRKHESLAREALDCLGPEFDGRAFLRACGALQEDAAPVLPDDLRGAFAAMLRRHFGASEAAAITYADVVGGDAEGYSFRYAIDGRRDDAFAIKYRDHWVFAPGPVDVQDLAAATAAFLKHFDRFIALMLHMQGSHDALIEQARAAVFPERALWTHERDPQRLSQKYPLVFIMNNGTEIHRTFYCGYNPLTGESQAYDFG